MVRPVPVMRGPLGSVAIIMLLPLTACGGGGGSSAPDIVQLPTPAPAPTPTPTPAPMTGYVLTADVSYGSGPIAGGSLPLLLDVYQPNQSCVSPRPTVMFVHGGGFVGGSRKGANVEAIANELARAGINLISIQYRLQGDAPIISSEFAAFERDSQSVTPSQPPERVRAFVAAVEDSVRALRWVESNASRFCIDAGRIGLWGSSAGAYTVLHVAYSLNPYAIARPQPRVVVDYWGGLFRDSDLEAAEAPLFVLHGTADTTVPYSEAIELTDRARQVGVPFTLYTLTGGGHDFVNSGFFVRTVEGQSLARRTADFVAAHLNSGGVPLYETRSIP